MSIFNPLEQFTSDSMFNLFFYSSGLFLDFSFTNYSLTAVILIFFLIITANIFSFYYEIGFSTQTHFVVPFSSRLRNRRYFSTSLDPQGPERGWFSNLRIKINNIMQALIQNKNYQQQYLLLVYTILISYAAFYCFRADAVILVISLIGILVGLVIVGRRIFSHVKTFDNYTHYMYLLGSIWFVGLLFYGYYYSIILISFFLGAVYFKNQYLEKTKENPTTLTIFLKDQNTIENHFEKEFTLFYNLRLVNLLLAPFLIFGSSWFFSHYNPIDIAAASLYVNAGFLLLFVFCFNSFLILFIQIIIIWFCNAPTVAKLLSTCAACGATGLSGILIYTTGHLGMTTPGVDPIIQHEWGYAYQKKVMGFAAKDGASIAVGKTHQFFLPDNPPVDAEGFLDKTKAQRALDDYFNKQVHFKSRIAYNSVVWGKWATPPAPLDSTPPFTEEGHAASSKK